MTHWFILLILAGVIWAVLHLTRTKQPLQKVQLSQNRDEYTFEIVGENSYQDALKSIAGAKGQESKCMFIGAVVEHEPSNPYDANAMRVSINGKTVGYFSKAHAAKMRQSMLQKNISLNTKLNIPAVIVGGWRNSHSEGHYGVKLNFSL